MPDKEHWKQYLDEIHQTYRNNFDPLGLLDALLVSWRGGLPLPSWAHELLGMAAHKYLKSDDNVSFDELLGLKASRGRDTHPLKKRRNKEFRTEVAYRAAEANRRYGFTLPVTFWLLSKTGVDERHLSPARLEEIYKSEDHDYSWDWSNGEFLFTTCSNRGYFDAIFNGERELRELGLYESAIGSIRKMLDKGE